MQKKKPTGKKAPNPEQVEKFVSGADHAPEAPKTNTSPRYPWEAPSVRDDVTKVFNLRLPEKTYLKLKWLAENTPKTSMQKICLESVESVVDHEVMALLAKMEEAEKYK